MQRFPHSRRSFLSSTAALALAGTAAPAYSRQDQPKPSAADLVSGKDARLEVLVPFPAVLETPLPLLIPDRLTPKSLLFVRNNAQPADAATLNAASPDGWKITLDGGVSRSLTVSVSDLQKMIDVPHTPSRLIVSSPD
ncbi:MAG: hypothetical protein R3C49_03520 [Planctomycetaceae bacterium]